MISFFYTHCSSINVDSLVSNCEDAIKNRKENPLFHSQAYVNGLCLHLIHTLSTECGDEISRKPFSERIEQIHQYLISQQEAVEKEPSFNCLGTFSLLAKIGSCFLNFIYSGLCQTSSQVIQDVPRHLPFTQEEEPMPRPLSLQSQKKIIPAGEQLILSVIRGIKAQFDQFEAQDQLPDGYSLSIEETITREKGRTLSARITPSKTRRAPNTEISMPESPSCPFCAYANRTHPNQEAQITDLPDECYTVPSRDKQILVITNSHHNHWFALSENKQLDLMRNVLKERDRARNSSSLQISNGIVFNCGKNSSQTVPHIHARTGIYPR